MRKDKKDQEDFFEGDRVKSLRAKTKNQKSYIISINVMASLSKKKC